MPEEEQSGELHRLTVRRGEERRADERRRARPPVASPPSSCALAHRTKEHAAKEPLLHYRRQDHGHHDQQHEGHAVRRAEEVSDRADSGA